MRPSWLLSPSAPLASISPSMNRIASEVASKASMMARVTFISRSRSSASKLSQAWVTDSRRLNPRNPVVPLMVWMQRKTRAISSPSDGLSLHADQIPVQLVEGFLALDQELGDHVLHVRHG